MTESLGFYTCDTNPCFTACNNQPKLLPNNLWEEFLLASDKIFVAGQTYDVKLTNIGSLLSIYVDGELDSYIQMSDTYVPTVGKLMVGWSAGMSYEPAKATI